MDNIMYADKTKYIDSQGNTIFNGDVFVYKGCDKFISSHFGTAVLVRFCRRENGYSHYRYLILGEKSYCFEIEDCLIFLIKIGNLFEDKNILDKLCFNESIKYELYLHTHITKYYFNNAVIEMYQVNFE